MRVNLGSIEVDDEMRRLIRKHVKGVSGVATRDEVRDFVIKSFCAEIEIIEQIEVDRGV